MLTLKIQMFNPEIWTLFLTINSPVNKFMYPINLCLFGHCFVYLFGAKKNNNHRQQAKILYCIVTGGAVHVNTAHICNSLGGNRNCFNSNVVIAQEL